MAACHILMNFSRVHFPLFPVNKKHIPWMEKRSSVRHHPSQFEVSAIVDTSYTFLLNRVEIHTDILSSSTEPLHSVENLQSLHERESIGMD